MGVSYIVRKISWVLAKKYECVVCKKKTATLHLEDDLWICEDCAQDMNDMRPDDDYAIKV